MDCSGKASWDLIVWPLWSVPKPPLSVAVTRVWSSELKRLMGVDYSECQFIRYSTVLWYIWGFNADLVCDEASGVKTRNWSHEKTIYLMDREGEYIYLQIVSSPADKTGSFIPTPSARTKCQSWPVFFNRHMQLERSLSSIDDSKYNWEWPTDLTGRVQVSTNKSIVWVME